MSTQNTNTNRAARAQRASQPSRSTRSTRSMRSMRSSVAAFAIALFALPLACGTAAAQSADAPYSAETLDKPTGASKGPDAGGFIQRWLLLGSIPVSGQLGDAAARATIESLHFSEDLTEIPEDGDTVTLGGETLTWHAVDTTLYNVNLYHYAYALGRPTSNVLFWAVTVIDAPREMKDVRLAIGSNSASIWWLNGEEVTSVFVERQTVIDDAVSKRITLKKGRNVLRAAIVNGGGAVDFCARFLDANAEPVLEIAALTQ